MKNFIIKHPTWIIVLIICSSSVILGLAMVPLIMKAPGNSFFDYAVSVVIPTIFISAFVSTPVVYSYKKIIFENLEMIEKLQKDSLTGLLNRYTFIEKYDRLAAEMRHQRKSLALIMIDLDNFKRINDTYGHVAGDLVIRTVGLTIKNSAREQDLLCRFGGDEFLIVQWDLTADEALKTAQQIQMATQTAILYKNQRIFYTASIGLVYHNECPDDLDELICEADSQMYEAKAKGKNQLIGNF
jgi:diguanylate cyclase (GGDEF)-like protein